jgi:hypothetical protein
MLLMKRGVPNYRIHQAGIPAVIGNINRTEWEIFLVALNKCLSSTP